MSGVKQRVTSTRPTKLLTEDFLGNGEMASLIRSFNWAPTSLGEIGDWPQSLRTTVSIVLESPVPMVVLWGTDGIMLYNDAYAVFAGARHPQLLGSKVVEGWPEVADFNRNVMKRGLKGEALSYKDQQLTLYRNNAPEAVWMDLNYSSVMGESGQPAGVLAIVVETTQRILAEQRQQQAEDTLRVEREQFHTLFMQAPALIATLRGPGHVYELANPLYRRLVGQRKLVGRPFRQARPELAGQGIYEILDQVYRTGKPYFGREMPVKLDRKGSGDHEVGYFNFIYQPSYDESNRVDGIFVHAVEITDQVQARQQAEASETHFRFMAETLPLKIFTSSPEGKVTYFNPQWSEYTGLPMAQLHQEGVQQLLHPDDLEESMSTWRQAIKTGEPLQNEQRLRRFDGEYRRHVSYVRAMRDHSGKIVSWFGSMTDIEDALQSAVRTNKLELMAAGLREQRAQLMAINSAKDEFIALASHQLRTPATAVKQYISLVLKGYFGHVTPEQRRHLQTAYDSNERQLNIINDLLKTAQIDSKGYVLNKEPQDISDVVREAIAEVASALELRRQQIVFEGEADTSRVLVDRNEMKMVFTNLLENASKYSYPDTTITVRLRKTGAHIEVDVCDVGVGFSSDNAKRIFDKFTRIDNELSDTVTGSGLGLYWVKKIVTLHRGTIKTRSALGKGSTFTVKFPL